MIQTARHPAMESSVAAHRPEYEEAQASGGMQPSLSRESAVRGPPPCTAEARSMQPLTIYTAEGRARKRFQRTTSENEDPSRKPGFSIPFGRQNNTNNTAPPDQKLPQHARRRSTLRDSKAPLLGPRPLQNNRYTEFP